MAELSTPVAGTRFGLVVEAQGSFSASEIHAMIEQHALAIQRGVDVLVALRAVLVAHQATLSGCGCCGSPLVSHGEDSPVRFDSVNVEDGMVLCTLAIKHRERDTWVRVPLRLNAEGTLSP